MYENTAKSLSLVIRYVSGLYKTHEMCNKMVVENGGTLIFVSDCLKIKKCVIKLLITILIH